MIKVRKLAELEAHVGRELGTAQWVLITQAMIDAFAAVTRDRHWIHTDPERAAAEGGFGGTLAHGFLTLSLLTSLLEECREVEDAKRWLNYGLDKVRFTSAVKAGQRVRLRLALGAYESTAPGSAKLTCKCTMELEGSERPAFVADFMMVGYE